MNNMKDIMKKLDEAYNYKSELLRYFELDFDEGEEGAMYHVRDGYLVTYIPDRRRTDQFVDQTALTVLFVLHIMPDGRGQIHDGADAGIEFNNLNELQLEIEILEVKRVL